MLREIYYPSPELQGIVSHYLAIEFINEIPDIPCTMPKGACGLVILYSGQLHEFSLSKNNEVYIGHDFICGYMLKTALLKNTGAIKAIITLFTPLGSWYLFGTAPGEYAGQFIPVEYLAGSLINRIHEQIQSAKNPSEAVNYLDNFLRHIKLNHYKEMNLCSQITRYIMECHGNIRINEIIKEFNLCSRTIDRHFIKYLGVTPKEYAWLTRLNIAMNSMMFSYEIPVHEIIYELGYYDQSHFINEVKRFLGRTPEFLKKNNHLSVIYHLNDFLALKKS